MNGQMKLSDIPDELIHSGIDFLDDHIGSDDILEHHGILGQKWGVRRFQNKDGSLTDEGRKRYASDWKQLENDRMSGKDKRQWKEFQDEKNAQLSRFKRDSEDLTKASKRMDDLNTKAESMLEDYNEFPQKYHATSGLANQIINDYKYNSPKMSDVADMLWFYGYEDGDQQDINGWSCYFEGKGKYEEANELSKEYYKATTEYRAAQEKITKDILGIHGDEKMYSYPSSHSIAEDIALNITNEKVHSQNAVELTWGTEGKPTLNDKEKKAIKQATEFVNKLDINKRSLDMISEAVIETGLENVDWRDMTPKQFDALNERLRAY